MFALKKIVYCALAIQIGIASAFAPSGAGLMPSRGTNAAAFKPHAAVHSSTPKFTSRSISATALGMSTPTIDKVTNKVTSDQMQDDNEWIVRLFNDPMNKREFVARCLIEICSLDDGQAYGVMMRAHQSGVAPIGKYCFEVAESHRSSLLTQGLTVDMIPAEAEE